MGAQITITIFSVSISISISLSYIYEKNRYIFDCLVWIGCLSDNWQVRNCEVEYGPWPIVVLRSSGWQWHVPQATSLKTKTKKKRSRGGGKWRSHPFRSYNCSYTTITYMWTNATILLRFLNNKGKCLRVFLLRLY